MAQPQPVRLQVALSQLLVIDVQARLLPHIAGCDALLEQIERIARAARVLELPRTLSEQYPQGLGGTDPRILAAADGAPLLQKMTFGVCADPTCRARLAELRRPQVLLAGIEAHVCVQQTALELVELGWTPVLLADAVGSRRPFDREIALERMRAAGVLITTVEAAIYELMQRAGTELFKRMLPVVK
jgi:nicotinamidase-related amidase